MSASASLDFCRSFEREFQLKHRTADAQALAWPGRGGAYMTTVTSNSQLGSVKPCISHGKTNKRTTTRCAHRRPVCSLPPLGASPLFAELAVWPQADYPRGLEAIPSCRATGMLSARLPCAGATETEENATEEDKASGERCHRSAYRPRARVNTPDCLPCAPSLRGGARARAPLCPLQACLHPKCALVLPCACAPAGCGG